MKKLILLMAVSAVTFNSFAGDDDPKKKHEHKYCAKMKDGTMQVMHNGKEITSDVTLSDGSKIKTNGVVTKKDGTVVTLQDGECMDMDGKKCAADKEKSKK
jgi:hypothetical protein